MKKVHSENEVDSPLINDFDDANTEHCSQVHHRHPFIRAKLRSSFRPSFSCNPAGLILMSLLNVIVIIAVLAIMNWNIDQDSFCIRKTSFYSPIHKRIPPSLVTKQINASVLPDITNPAHICRIPPSPAVDEAWDRITRIGIHGIDVNDVLKLDKDPKLAIQPPSDWGFGERPYMAEIDVFHQLHCLNTLRKALIVNYEYYWGAKWGFEPPLMFTTHLEHCIDVLRQNIMCHSDVDVITYNWVAGQNEPFPDFNIFKTCRDFDALLEWQEKSVMAPKMQHEKWVNFTRPDRTMDLPHVPGLAALGNMSTGMKHGVAVMKLGISSTCKV